MMVRFDCGVGLIALLLITAVGCGANPGRLTGKVSVNGNEVIVGNMAFNPDIDAGIDGPSVLADVKDGVYVMFGDNAFTPGKNTVMLTVARKWLTSNGQDTSPMGATEPTTILSQSFVLPELTAGSYDLDFVFDSKMLKVER